MSINKKELAVVWLKRDLRLSDHEALHNALATKKRCLLMYVFEDILLSDFHYSARHFDFIKQSIVEMNNQLKLFNTQVLCLKGSVIEALDTLSEQYSIALYSHQETGIGLTFERDKSVKQWADKNGVHWNEFLQQGVFRGLPNRKKWIHLWTAHMNRPLFNFSPEDGQFISAELICEFEKEFEVMELNTPKSQWFQPGGEQKASRYLNSFFERRYLNYQKHISKPDLARKSCSRLSPYIAWGNISMRQVLQRTQEEKERGNKSRALVSFGSRLRWQAHFISSKWNAVWNTKVLIRGTMRW